MLAVTPSFAVLIALARSVRVLMPLLPVVYVAALPVGGVMVIVSPVGKLVVASFTGVEEKEAIVARLLTTITLLLEAVPEAAEPVTMLGSDEFTVAAENGPDRLFIASMSLSRVVASAWICFKAVVWLCSVVCCDSHASSGACAAVTDAVTAAFTSMPVLVAPVAAARMLLKSVAVAAFVDANSEFSAETELISFACSFVRDGVEPCASLLQRFYPAP
jgi:hypothetical protein